MCDIISTATNLGHMCILLSFFGFYHGRCIDSVNIFHYSPILTLLIYLHRQVMSPNYVPFPINNNSLRLPRN